jgi:hypothetical protein
MPSTLLDELLAEARPIWQAMIAHPFLHELATGTLSRERFHFWVQQDYRFVQDGIRFLGLLIARAPDEELRRGLLDAARRLPQRTDHIRGVRPPARSLARRRADADLSRLYLFPPRDRSHRVLGRSPHRSLVCGKGILRRVVSCSSTTRSRASLCALDRKLDESAIRELGRLAR